MFIPHIRFYWGIYWQVETMTIEEWESERVRLDADLVQARAAGIGVRTALTLVFLHKDIKPTEKKEQEKEKKEEAPIEPNKNRKAELDAEKPADDDDPMDDKPEEKPEEPEVQAEDQEEQEKKDAAPTEEQTK